VALKETVIAIPEQEGAFPNGSFTEKQDFCELKHQKTEEIIAGMRRKADYSEVAMDFAL